MKIRGVGSRAILGLLVWAQVSISHAGVEASVAVRELVALIRAGELTSPMLGGLRSLSGAPAATETLQLLIQANGNLSSGEAASIAASLPESVLDAIHADLETIRTKAGDPNLTLDSFEEADPIANASDLETRLKDLGPLKGTLIVCGRLLGMRNLLYQGRTTLEVVGPQLQVIDKFMKVQRLTDESSKVQMTLDEADALEIDVESPLESKSNPLVDKLATQIRNLRKEVGNAASLRAASPPVPVDPVPEEGSQLELPLDVIRNKDLASVVKALGFEPCGRERIIIETKSGELEKVDGDLAETDNIDRERIARFTRAHVYSEAVTGQEIYYLSGFPIDGGPSETMFVGSGSFADGLLYPDGWVHKIIRRRTDDLIGLVESAKSQQRNDVLMTNVMNREFPGLFPDAKYIRENEIAKRPRFGSELWTMERDALAKTKTGALAESLRALRRMEDKGAFFPEGPNKFALTRSGIVLPREAGLTVAVEGSQIAIEVEEESRVTGLPLDNIIRPKGLLPGLIRDHREAYQIGVQEFIDGGIGLSPFLDAREPAGPHAALNAMIRARAERKHEDPIQAMTLWWTELNKKADFFAAERKVDRSMIPGVVLRLLVFPWIEVNQSEISTWLGALVPADGYGAAMVYSDALASLAVEIARTGQLDRLEKMKGILYVAPEPNPSLRSKMDGAVSAILHEQGVDLVGPASMLPISGENAASAAWMGIDHKNGDKVCVVIFRPAEGLPSSEHTVEMKTYRQLSGPIGGLEVQLLEPTPQLVAHSNSREFEEEYAQALGRVSYFGVDIGYERFAKFVLPTLRLIRPAMGLHDIVSQVLSHARHLSPTEVDRLWTLIAKIIPKGAKIPKQREIAFHLAKLDDTFNLGFIFGAIVRYSSSNTSYLQEFIDLARGAATPAKFLDWYLGERPDIQRVMLGTENGSARPHRLHRVGNLPVDQLEWGSRANDVVTFTSRLDRGSKYWIFRGENAQARAKAFMERNAQVSRRLSSKAHGVKGLRVPSITLLQNENGLAIVRLADASASGAPARVTHNTISSPTASKLKLVAEDLQNHSDLFTELENLYGHDGVIQLVWVTEPRSQYAIILP